MTQATNHQPRQLRKVELLVLEYALLSQPQGLLSLDLLLPLLMLLSALQLLLRTRCGAHTVRPPWCPRGADQMEAMLEPAIVGAANHLLRSPVLLPT